MSNLYILTDSEGRGIGLFTDINLATDALFEHASSFLDDVVIVHPSINLDHEVLRQVRYVEGVRDMGVDLVLQLNTEA